ncbi:hypothetical protein D3C87_1242080 [compost metagenome]
MPLVDVADPLQSGLQRRRIALDQKHVQTGVEHGHGDAGAHGSTADHAGPLKRARLRGTCRRFAGLSFGEESMRQPLVLGTGQALQKGLAFELQACLQGLLQRGLQAVKQQALGGQRMTSAGQALTLGRHGDKPRLPAGRSEGIAARDWRTVAQGLGLPNSRIEHGGFVADPIQ